MKTISLQTKKWVVRALLSVGALLGLSSCHSHKQAVISHPDGYNNNPNPELQDLVYGPPPTPISDRPVRVEKIKPEPQELVYGPPPRVILYDNGPKVPSQISGEPIYDEPAKAKKAKKSKSAKKVKKSKKVKKNKK